MEIIWGAVSSQYWEQQDELYPNGYESDALEPCWSHLEIESSSQDGLVNVVQAFYAVFENEYYTAGANWYNNTASDYFGEISIYLHSSLGYGVNSVEFYHTDEHCGESRHDMFLRCVAQRFECSIDIVQQALVVDDWICSKSIYKGKYDPGLMGGVV
jgi:hypothetical protein